ncbi:MAG: hypothetical protein KAS28_01915 [Desulfobacula sp.]|nr:hypothetical protein [Desulfobacula sp.]
MICIRSFNKEHQKKSPIQIPYHIKVSLQEYYEDFEIWPIPDFSDKCLICGGVDCATFLGYYLRIAICPVTGFWAPDLPILRYRCHDKGDVKVTDHITFSLLPHELVPFRQLSIDFMVRAIWFKVSRHLSFTRAMDAIEDELNHLGDVANFINISTMISWQRMILTAFGLFISADINMVSKSQYEQLQNTAGLKLFLDLLINHQSQSSNHPIRGPDTFAWDYYQQSGGLEQNAFFLFGRASQHRK